MVGDQRVDPCLVGGRRGRATPSRSSDLHRTRVGSPARVGSSACASPDSPPVRTPSTASSPATSTSTASRPRTAWSWRWPATRSTSACKLLEEEHRLADVRLLAPVLPRSKVVGIGRNYAAHAAEMGNDVPDEPLMFLKPNTSVIGPGDPIIYPPQTSNLHYEGELAVVIGRICRDVPRGAGDRRHPRLHDRQRRHRPRPAEERRAVHPRQGLRLVLPARAVDRDRPRPGRLHQGPPGADPPQRRRRPGRHAPPT